MLDEVKNIIIVLSGKGGVGKSTVSTQLALTLRENGFKVGLLDIDLCGPSVPHILGLEGESVHQGEAGWVPVYMDKDQRLAVMSVAFLLKTRNSPVIWRGPKKTAMIKQFLDDVYWQDLDYLVIDTPPGTSDEHLTVMEVLSKSKAGIVVVTTPQHLALDDVRKQLSFCKGTPLKVMGLIENMSGYVCPTCDTCSTIWGSGGGEQLAKRASIPFLGSLPIDPKLSLLAGNGGVAVRDAPDSQVSKVLQSIVQSIVAATQEQPEEPA